jgi:hypothetical protein
MVNHASTDPLVVTGTFRFVAALATASSLG